MDHRPLPENGGVGDSGILTSVGVHLGMRAGAEAALGTTDLSGVTVGVIGTGKVGGRLIGHLIRDRAQVIAMDPSAAARSSLDAEYPNAITWSIHLPNFWPTDHRCCRPMLSVGRLARPSWRTWSQRRFAWCAGG